MRKFAPSAVAGGQARRSASSARPKVAAPTTAANPASTSVSLALAVGVAELGAWGIAVGAKEKLGTLRTIGVTAVNVSLGLAVVGLKLLIH